MVYFVLFSGWFGFALLQLLCYAAVGSLGSWFCDDEWSSNWTIYPPPLTCFVAGRKNIVGLTAISKCLTLFNRLIFNFTNLFKFLNLIFCLLEMGVIGEGSFFL